MLDFVRQKEDGLQRSTKGEATKDGLRNTPPHENQECHGTLFHTLTDSSNSLALTDFDSGEMKMFSLPS